MNTNNKEKQSAPNIGITTFYVALSLCGLVLKAKAADCFGVFSSGKSSHCQQENTPYTFFKKMFEYDYKLCKSNQSESKITCNAFLKALDQIKNVHEKRWEKNKLINGAETEIDHITGQCSLLEDLNPVFEKVILYPNDQIYIHGDIHGDVLSLISLLVYLQKKNLMNARLKLKSNQKILLLGDYTDRGLYDIEVIILLEKLLSVNPNNVFLLRGNHETRNFDFKETLEERFSRQPASINFDPSLSADFAHMSWLLTSSYFPHVILLCIQSPKKTDAPQKVIACMHAAPPSNTWAKLKPEELRIFQQHCSAISSFLDQSKKTLTQIPLNLIECCQMSSNFPRPASYLWNYLEQLTKQTKQVPLPKTNGRPLLSEDDLTTWMQLASSKNHTITAIYSGHQQHERALFNQPGAYGIGPQFNQKSVKFNIAPRCILPQLRHGSWENRVDTWGLLRISKDSIAALTPIYFNTITGEETDLLNLPSEQINLQAKILQKAARVAIKNALKKEKEEAEQADNPSNQANRLCSDHIDTPHLPETATDLSQQKSHLLPQCFDFII